MPEVILVSGCGKTSTSSVVGAINASANAFLLYEGYLCGADGLSPRAEEFFRAFPSYAKGLTSQTSLASCYAALSDLLARDGHPFDVVGDKILIANLSPAHRAELKHIKTIFMVRDVRTWLCKNVVVKDFKDPHGLAGKGISYVRYLLEAFKWNQVLRFSMEQFLMDNDASIHRLFGFLGHPTPSTALEWWTSVGNYPAASPKSAVRWWVGHDSSRLRPERLDTHAVLKEHAFWSAVLPIFDKYYLNLDKAFFEQEVEKDVAELGRLSFPDLAMQDLYEEADSVSFGSGELGSSGHRSTNPHVKPYVISAGIPGPFGAERH